MAHLRVPTDSLNVQSKLLYVQESEDDLDEPDTLPVQLSYSINSRTGIAALPHDMHFKISLMYVLLCYVSHLTG